jgi:hypothetical protein
MQSPPKAFDTERFRALLLFLRRTFAVSADQAKRFLLPVYEELYAGETPRFRQRRMADDLSLIEHKTFYAVPSDVLPRILKREKPRATPLEGRGLAGFTLIKWQAAVGGVDIGPTPLFRFAASDGLPTENDLAMLVRDHPGRNTGWHYDLSAPLAPLYSDSFTLKQFVDVPSETNFGKLLIQTLALNELWLRNWTAGIDSDELWLSTRPETAFSFTRKKTNLWYLWNDKPKDLHVLCRQAHDKGQDFEIW